MKEKNTYFDSFDAGDNLMQERLHKPCPFFMHDNLTNIRDLVIQMSRLPLRGKESNDSQR